MESTTHYAEGSRPAASGDYASARTRPTMVRLVTDILVDTRELVSTELTLARTELMDAVDTAKAGAASLAGGAAVLLIGLGALVAAAILSLSLVVASWLAALIVAGISLLVGAVMVSSGKKRMSTESFRPDRTLRAVKRDANVIKEKL